jgi:hypothetical protein
LKKRRCVIAVAFQLCFRVGHWEGSGKPGCLKLNGIHQGFFSADDINTLGGRVRAIQVNTISVVVASKENKLAVNSDKTKYMVMYRDQNAERNQNIKIGNRSFETVKKLK